LRPLLLNSEDLRGGAARAAYRLHLALRAAGTDSRMLVQVRHGDDETVIGPRSRIVGRLRAAADLLPLVFYPRRSGETFYPGWLPDTLPRRVGQLDPDIVHLHWITGGFLNVASLRRLRRPLVWTLHDMWAFTGGCHYDEGCGRYAGGCGRCPVLGSRSASDLSSAGWRRKQRRYLELPLNIVTPSRWLGGLAAASPLLGRYPVEVIPNPIDTNVFRPIDKAEARQALRIEPGRHVILFGALRATSETRKGYRHLESALRGLAASRPELKPLAVVFGADRPARPPDLGVECLFAGTLMDDTALARLYSAADVLVAPSTQENLSNAVLESLACGTPVAAFDIGGMPDMIEHRRNGYLARPLDAEDLGHGISWILEDDARRRILSERARNKVLEEFESSRIARRYLELYEQSVKGNDHG
jgi:glycosyltransferase involved in cell wall biosynthesis